MPTLDTLEVVALVEVADNSDQLPIVMPVQVQGDKETQEGIIQTPTPKSAQEGEEGRRLLAHNHRGQTTERAALVALDKHVVPRQQHDVVPARLAHEIVEAGAEALITRALDTRLAVQVVAGKARGMQTP